MGKSEADILLEAEDKIAVIETFIDDWHEASDVNVKTPSVRQYCLGRAHGLETCLPTIKKLIEDLEEID